MEVVAVEFDLRFPGSRTLKDESAVLRPMVDGLRSRRLTLSVAETGYQELWQGASVGVVDGRPSASSDG